MMKITAEQARNKIGTCAFLDVRDAEDYTLSHIPGAVNLQEYDLMTEAENILPDKEAPVIVYCYGGVRSRRCAMRLEMLGYRNVLDMGGFDDWPYETEK